MQLLNPEENFLSPALNSQNRDQISILAHIVGLWDPVMKSHFSTARLLSWLLAAQPSRAILGNKCWKKYVIHFYQVPQVT